MLLNMHDDSTNEQKHKLCTLRIIILQELNKFQEAETELNSLGSYSAHKVGFSH